MSSNTVNGNGSGITDVSAFRTVLDIPNNNFTATSAPSVNDDVTEGYSVGSKWYDLNTDTLYVCADATEGAAVWAEAPLLADNLGSSAFIDTEDLPVSDLTQAELDTKSPYPDAMMVEGAGTTALNGIYLRDGSSDGKAKYTLDGSDSDILWVTDEFQIRSAAIAFYTSGDDVVTPDLATTWTVAGGDAPAPTVRLATWEEYGNAVYATDGHAMEHVTGGSDKIRSATSSRDGLMTSAYAEKLDNIEEGATADQTGAEIKLAYEAEADTNAFTDAEKAIVGNTSGVNTGDQDLSGLALKSNVLELDNTDAFTPSADYHPATKKYVDDNSGGGGGGGGGDALTSNPLSQFAATTSAQLAGVISDETGGGALVFANSPTLITPVLGTPASGNLANCTFPTLNQSTTGNAATATALETARTINGTSFDGTSNITITCSGATLTGTTLAANIVSSSLTSVGTLTNLTVTNTITGSISGNAATVTDIGNLTGPVTSTGRATAIADGALSIAKTANLQTTLDAKETPAGAQAKADAAQAFAIQRANHTGTQAQSTITDLETDLAAKAPLYATTITDSTTARTLALTDAGKYIRLTNASGCAITVPEQASVAWAADTEISFRVAAAGSPSIVEGAGVTVNGKEKAATLVQHDAFGLKRVAENIWDFI